MACSRRIRWISTLAALLAAVACDAGKSARQSAGGAVAVRDSADVTIVENAEVDPKDVARWVVDTTPSITIGTSAGDSAYEFARIGGVRRLPNGMIVVLNGQGETAFEFRFYDSTGKHIATHGRRGQGPGEYRWITFFGPVGGDTVIGVDFPNGRLNWVSATSGYLRSARLDENGFRKVVGDDAAGALQTMVPLGDSLYAIKAFREIPNSSGMQRTTTFHLVDLVAGKSSDVARYDDPPFKEVQLSFGPTSVWPMSAGSASHVVDRARRRICAGISSAPELSCVDSEGKRMSIRWRAERVPYTAEDRRTYEETFRRTRRGSRGSSEADLNKLLAATDWPEHHNPFTALQIDSDGNFWVLEPTLDSAGRRQSQFRILDPDGRHIAFADPFPTRSLGLINTVDIGKQSVLRVIEDADGAPVVGLFRIRKPD